MFPSISPEQTASWKKLKTHYEQAKNWRLIDLFAADPDRFKKYSIRHGDILVDYSKNIFTGETLSLLFQLAEECELKAATEAMFNGERINKAENRQVLHTALRNFSGRPVTVDGKDIMTDVKAVNNQMKTFCAQVHNGEWKGFTGKKIRFIVNIGIGGSDLGPFMVTEALRPYKVPGIETFFVSNVDGTHIAETLKKL
ncbi:MAG TPA: hypothetical protein VK618_10315, partial [Flavitalea sp.]|nr:hypothetical protein [Flavitalea sp.]